LLYLPDPRIDRRKQADKFSARFSLSSVTPLCRAAEADVQQQDFTDRFSH
jgi:hypothetical protein